MFNEVEPRSIKISRGRETTTTKTTTRWIVRVRASSSSLILVSLALLPLPSNRLRWSPFGNEQRGSLGARQPRRDENERENRGETKRERLTRYNDVYVSRWISREWRIRSRGTVCRIDREACPTFVARRTKGFDRGGNPFAKRRLAEKAEKTGRDKNAGTRRGYQQGRVRSRVYE